MKLTALALLVANLAFASGGGSLGGGGGGGGLSSINSDSTAAQTLTVGTTGNDFNIADDAAGGHVFHLPDAAATKRGAVTTGAQAFGGVKTFGSAPIISSATASRPMCTDGSKAISSTCTGLILNADLAGSIAASKLVGTDIVTVGTITSGTWNGTAIGVAYGGTNIASYTAGDTLYASGTTTLSKLAKGTGLQYYRMNAGATAPEWATLSTAPSIGDAIGSSTTKSVLFITSGNLAQDPSNFAYDAANTQLMVPLGSATKPGITFPSSNGGGAQKDGMYLFAGDSSGTHGYNNLGFVLTNGGTFVGGGVEPIAVVFGYGAAQTSGVGVVDASGTTYGGLYNANIASVVSIGMKGGNTTEAWTEYIRVGDSNGANISFWKHIRSRMTPAPSASVNANAGTSATCAVTHKTDTIGVVTIVAGSASLSSGVQCDVTFGTEYAFPPMCLLQPVTTNAASASQYVTSTIAALTINTNAALTASQTYTWNYFCMEPVN